MSARWLRSWWERRKAAAFPPGAVTFHLGCWTRGALDADAADRAGGLMAAHGLEELLLLHGNAVRADGRLVVIAGPSGVGKSTVCGELVRSHGARLVEDGLVLVGGASGAWSVVETGTLDVLARTSRVGRVVRRLSGTGRSLYRHREVRCPARWRALRRRVTGELPFSLAIVLTVRRSGAFSPLLHRLDRLVVLEHPDAPRQAFRIRRGGMTPLADPAADAPAHVAVTRLSPVGLRGDVQARLAAAVMGAPVAAV